MSNQRRNKPRQPDYRQQHQQRELEARFEQETIERRPSGAPPLNTLIVKESASTRELGSSGLSRWGGTVDEEFLNELRGSKGRKVYTEMRLNDPVVAAMLRCITWLCRSVDWTVNGENEKQVAFIEECMDDMSHSWDDFISEALTFLPYGWAWAEVVYKYRKGEEADPPSKYDDGKIGWRKLAFRAQTTLWEWQFDEAGGVNGMVQNTGNNKPIAIPIEKSLLFRTSVEKGNPEGESILRASYRSWLFKKNLEEVEGIGIERNLNGLPVCYLGEGANTSANITAAKQLVRDVRKDDQMGIVIPGPKQTADGKGWLLELLSGGNLESADIGNVIARYEKRIALSMLAQWLMLGMDQVGSYALSQDQTDFFRQAVEAVLKMIASVLNRFAIPRLLKLNPSLQKKGELPTIEYSLPVKPDFKAFAETVNLLVGAGVLKAEDQTVKDAVRGLLGLPEEEELPEPEEMPVKPGPEQMMQAAAATAQQPGQPPQPEAPPKPMPPEMVEQQGKLQAAAAQMQKGGPGSGNWGHAGVPGNRGGSMPGGGAHLAAGAYGERKAEGLGAAMAGAGAGAGTGKENDESPDWAKEDWQQGELGRLSKMSKKTGNEHLMTFDENGELIGEFEGTKYGVDYIPPFGSRGYVTAHTHPNSAPFSKEDIDGFASDKRERGAIVLGKNGTRYVLTKPASYTETSKARESFSYHQQKLSGQYHRASSGRSARAKADAYAEYMHSVVEATAKDLGLTYTRYLPK